MSVISLSIEMWEFNRGRTLATLDDIAKQADPQAILGWRPGPGRAHIAWQLMHIGITEELFGTARLRGIEPAFSDLVPRFKGGSTPDDNIPTVAQIREVLETGRKHLKETFASLSDDNLGTIPEAFQERGWTLGTILKIIAWHEAHHQGQAHITLNLWKAANQSS
ncbi:MAG: DinB family protein [Planctomycetaceae bacterium]